MNKFAGIFAASLISVGCYSSAAASTGDFNLFGSWNKITASSERSTRNMTVDGEYGMVKVTRGITVNMTDGTGPTKVKISGPSNIVELTDVSVKDGVLVVDFTENFSLKGDNVTVDVSGKMPSGYKVSAGGTINVNSAVTVAGEVSVGCSAGGEINVNGNVNAGSIDISCSAGGEIEVKGVTVVKNASVRCSAGGEIDVENINATSVDAKVSAGGEIKVCGKADTVSAKASAGGEIDVRKLSVSKYGDMKASAGGEIRR